MPKKKSKSPLKNVKVPATLFPRPPSPPAVKTKARIKRSKSTTAVSKPASTPVATKLKGESKKAKIPAVASAPVKPKKPKPPLEKPPSPPQIDEQETSQMWVLRHLRLHLEDIDDAVLANFVLQQDVTPFRNFMLDFHNERRCIFILVCRNHQQLTVSPMFEATLSQASPDPTESPAKENKVETTPHKQPGKMVKPKLKAKARTKSKEPTKKDDSGPNKEEVKRQLIEEIVRPEITTVPNQEGALQLKWSSKRKIPDESDEFVFVVSRDVERVEEKSELDQSYFVGYCKNSRSFKRLQEIATLVLGTKMTFERTMDMLLYANNAMAGNPSGIREKWQNKPERFENFICDSLGQAYWHAAENQNRADSILSLTDQHSSVESVESLLRPRIHAFVKDANATTRIRLWLELSIYELKFVKVEEDAKTTGDRLSRLLAIFQTLTLLVSEKESMSTKEWLPKALFYTVELIARVIASNLKECTAELTADLFEESENALKVDPLVRAEIKPLFVKFIEIGMEDLFSLKSEEYGVLENIKQCLKVFDYIEEELEKMSKVVSFLRSPVHDMLVDRTSINQAFDILKNVWNLFQETYFESALESGNLETMKTVCLQVSSEQEKLKVISDDLRQSY